MGNTFIEKACMITSMIISILVIMFITVKIIKEYNRSRKWKKENIAREKQAQNDRIDNLEKYIRDVNTDLWKLTCEIQDISEKLNKKETKKNVKKKKRN